MIDSRSLAAVVVGHGIDDANRDIVRVRLDLAQPDTPLIARRDREWPPRKSMRFFEARMEPCRSAFDQCGG